MGNKSTSLQNSRSNESISETNKIKMERWIQMHYQIRERELALQISKSREQFYWLSAFYTVSMIGMIYRYRITKRSNNLIPIVPFTFTIAYVADLAYGSKQHRIRAEAEMIMQNESDLLEWPHGLPSVSSIDQARFDTEIEKKLHPVTP